MLKPTFLPQLKLIPLVLVIWLLLLPGTVTAKEWWQIEVKQIPIKAEIVKSETEQQLGLGNRFSLPEGQGMLFLYNRPGTRVFWMKRMNFPIDIIWFRNGSAVLIEESIPFPGEKVPDEDLEKYGSGVQADMVLELPAGFVKQNRLSVGDRFQILKRN